MFAFPTSDGVSYSKLALIDCFADINVAMEANLLYMCQSVLRVGKEDEGREA